MTTLVEQAHEALAYLASYHDGDTRFDRRVAVLADYVGVLEAGGFAAAAAEIAPETPDVSQVSDEFTDAEIAEQAAELLKQIPVDIGGTPA